MRFSSRAPIWAPGNAVYVGFPPELVPDMTAFDNLYASQFTDNARVREQVSDQTEATLDSVDDTNRIGRWIVAGIAIGLPAIFLVRMVIHILAIKIAQRREVSDIPDELSQPPTADDPAVVGVLWAQGKPDERAVAGTILGLAQRKAVSVEEYGERLVVRVPLMTTGERRLRDGRPARAARQRDARWRDRGAADLAVVPAVARLPAGSHPRRGERRLPHARRSGWSTSTGSSA